MKRSLSVVLALLFIGASGALSQDKVPGNIVSLFQKRCAGCHKGKTPPRGLSWESDRIAEAIGRPSAEMPALKIIDPSDPASSYLLKKVRGAVDLEGKRMPPSQALSKEEVEALETWLMGLKKS